MSFNPDPNAELFFNDERYTIAEHPSAPGMPYGQEGRTGIVYRLLPSNRSADQALKVFKPRFRLPYLVSQAEKLSAYADLPGLQAARRSVLSPSREADLLRQYPDLTYAVLMPWLDGPTWLEILLQKKTFLEQQSLSLSRALAEILVGMEERGLAHCDISGPNVMLPVLAGGVGIALIDLEGFYAPGMIQPQSISNGSAGYTHQKSGGRLWRPEADRFAGAVLLAEMLGWCDKQVCQASWGESYFEPGEMQQECVRYHSLNTSLRNHWGDGVANLFDRAWRSDSLADCPTFGEWLVVLPLSRAQAAIGQEQKRETQPEEPRPATNELAAQGTPGPRAPALAPEEIAGEVRPMMFPEVETDADKLTEERDNPSINEVTEEVEPVELTMKDEKAVGPDRSEEIEVVQTGKSARQSKPVQTRSWVIPLIILVVAILGILGVMLPRKPTAPSPSNNPTNTTLPVIISLPTNTFPPTETPSPTPTIPLPTETVPPNRIIHIWKVGSPYDENTPENVIPQDLQNVAASLGYKFTMDTFPAKGFDQVFLKAKQNGTQPEILLADNFGIFEGTTTNLGTFKGIGYDGLVTVDNSFNSLVYNGMNPHLISTSQNYQEARKLALMIGKDCDPGFTGNLNELDASIATEIKDFSTNVTLAYFNRDNKSLSTFSDGQFSLDPLFFLDAGIKVDNPPNICSVWGNEHLAFVESLTTVESDKYLGHSRLLQVISKGTSSWKLLLISLDNAITKDLYQKVDLKSYTQGRESLVKPVLLAPLDQASLPRWKDTTSYQKADTTLEWKTSGTQTAVYLIEYQPQDTANLAWFPSEFISVMPNDLSGDTVKITPIPFGQGMQPHRWRIWAIDELGNYEISEWRIVNFTN